MFKTLLGWCVVGPMINQTKSGKCGCNRIIFTSADTLKPGSHCARLEGRTWYVSHQGMLNPNKSRIRVAFDCSSQYKGT